MAKTFQLTVARVGENLFEGKAVSVSLPGTEGRFEILAMHEPFVSRLKDGTIHVKDAEGKSHDFDISAGGIAETSGSQATVLL